MTTDPTTDPNADPSTVGRYLALTLLVGAAHHDADPTQRAMIGERVLPPLRDNRLTGYEARKAAVTALLDIMGDGWVPSGEWATALRQIVPDAEDDQ